MIGLLAGCTVHAPAAPSGAASVSRRVNARADTTAVLDTIAVLRAVAARAPADAQQEDSVLRRRCAAGEQPACVAPPPRYVLLAAPGDTAYARLLRKPHQEVAVATSGLATSGLAASGMAPICPWAAPHASYDVPPRPPLDTAGRQTGVRLSVQIMPDTTAAPAAASPDVAAQALAVVVHYGCVNPWSRRRFESLTRYRVTRGPAGWTARAVSGMIS
ncbi:MAG TPA: hypothetical protein VEZ47_12550 [Gemmatirosa sp.]|nr:hypothetical protein [Gemmatirosa sp.]